MPQFFDIRQKLILASASSIRNTILTNAGLSFEVMPANIDEESIRAEPETGPSKTSPLIVAEHLAQEKAKHISVQDKTAFVIGSDQVLALGPEILGKPKNLDEAFERLLKLSGKTHQLHTAVSVAHKGVTTWSYGETVHMTMRDLTSGYIEKYLNAVGENVCSSVGAYQLEGLGVQLFSNIEGNYFSILGLCLLPLLEYLREEGIIES